MICQVLRNKETNEIEKVLAPNEKESILFKSLNELTNDKESALRYWAQVYTPSFKSWFGDWEKREGSKVVDENGEPLIVYHGSDTKFNTFRKNRPSQGIFFTSDMLYAMEFADWDHNTIYPAFLNVKNPLYEKEELYSEVVEKNRGSHDGVIGKDGPGGFIVGESKGVEYVAFDPNQIKSVFNQGTFSKDSNNINFSKLISFQDHVTDKLQQLDIIGAKKFQNEYWIKKTELYQDRLKYSPEDIERRNLEKIDDINKKFGSTVITTERKGNGYVIKINDQGLLFSEADTFPENIEEDPDFNEYIHKAIYDGKDKPITTDVLNNVSTIARDLGRQDLIDTSGLIYNYLKLNPGLSIEMVDNFDKAMNERDDFFPRDYKDVPGFYDFSLNKVFIDKTKLGLLTSEGNLELVVEELLHGMTVAPFFSRFTNEAEKKYLQEINEMYEFYKKNSDNKDQYRFSNPKEFIVGIMTSPKFREHLGSIDNENEIYGSKDNENLLSRLWNKLVSAVMRLLGINKSKTEEDYKPSPFNKMMDVVSDYLNKTYRIGPSSLKELGRNYNLDFDVVSESRLDDQKAQLRNKLTPEYQQKFKDRIENLLLQIKSVGKTRSIINAQDSFGFLVREANKLDENIIDQVDYFFSFSTEMNAVMDLALDRINGVKDLDKDNIAKLKEYSKIRSVINSYEPIIKQLQDLRETVADGIPLSGTIDDISVKAARIDSIYKNNIVPLISDMTVDILGQATTDAVKQVDDRIKGYQNILTRAEKNGNTKTIKQMQDKIKAQEDFKKAKLLESSEKANEWLRGRMGDSHTITTYLEAAIVNPNPIVSAVARTTIDSISRIGKELLPINNEFQDNIEKYSKDAGVSISNFNAFNSPFLHTWKEVESMNSDGTFVYKDVMGLLSPFTQEHIVKQQEYAFRANNIRNKIRASEDDAEIANLKEELNKVAGERKEFNRSYMEMPYLPEVHKALDLLDENLGGFTAREYMGDLYDKKSLLEKGLDDAANDTIADQIMSDIEAVDFEIKRLRATYEKEPGSKEYKVAQQLTKYDKEMKNYRTFMLSPRGEAKFKREKARVDQAFVDGDISEKEKNFWYQQNTITELSQDYWDKKKRILDQMGDLQESMGIKRDDSTLNDLYQKIESIAKPYRDNNGIINGTRASEKEAATVKEIEEEIEELKQNMEDIFGLTRKDKQALKTLYAEMEELDFQGMQYYGNSNMAANIQAQLSGIQDQIDQILAKKKNLSKRDVESYFKLIKLLSELDETTDTHYYEEEYLKHLDNYKETIQVKSVPSSFSYAGIEYNKLGDEWVAKADNGKKDLVTFLDALKAYKTKRASETFTTENDWYKKNHLERMRWISLPNPAQGRPTGEWQLFIEPIYLWRQTQPKNKEYINKNQPSFKYKRSQIKDEFKNSNYRESIDGYNVPRLVGAKDDSLLNHKYFELKNSNDSKDQAKLKMLHFLTNRYFESQESSTAAQGQRPGYKLPSVRKSKIERLAGTSIADTKNAVRDWFQSVKEEVEKNEQDKDILYGYNADMNTIPARYLGDIDIKDQTKDVTRALLMYISDAKRRELLSESFPYAKAVRDIVSDPDNKPVKINSKNQVITYVKGYLSKNSNKVIAKLIPGESMTAKHINEFIRTYYFGEAIKDEKGSKFVNSTLGLGAKSLLGLNFVSSISNRANAYLQSILETESYQFAAFNKKEMIKAQMIYDSNIHKLVQDLGKYGKKSYINQFIDYFGGLNLNMIDKNNHTQAYAKFTQGLAKILVPNEMAEHALGYQLVIASALHYKVKQGDKVIPLFEAFKLDNGNLQLKEGVEFSEEQRKNFVAKINAAARRINGNYNKMDKTLAQKYMLGRLFLFMNQYFVPFFSRRFGRQEFSAEEGVREEGFWRSAIRSIFQDTYKYQRNIILNWKNYSQQEKAAAIRTLSEISFSISIILMIMALGGAEPEKNKKNGWFANNLIYALKMIRRQNEQLMLVPGLGLDDIYNKLKSPFPIVGKIGNTFSMFNHAAYYLGYKTGIGNIDEKDVYYTKDTGWHKGGDLKMFSDFERLTGFLYKFHQIHHPDIALNNMDAYRIK